MERNAFYVPQVLLSARKCKMEGYDRCGLLSRSICGSNEERASDFRFAAVSCFLSCESIKSSSSVGFLMAFGGQGCYHRPAFPFLPVRKRYILFAGQSNSLN